MRLFLAINLPPSIKQQIDAIRGKLVENLAAGKAEIKWVRPEQLHITLRFLGECDPNIVPRLSEALSRGLVGYPEFVIDFKGWGCFPKRGPVKIIWLGIREGEETLKELAHRVEAACGQAGFPAESRPFSAHLTVGRVKGLKGGGKLRAVVESHTSEAGPFKVSSVDVMQSVLSSSGPTYTLLQQINLL